MKQQRRTEAQKFDSKSTGKLCQECLLAGAADACRTNRLPPGTGGEYLAPGAAPGKARSA